MKLIHSPALKAALISAALIASALAAPAAEAAPALCVLSLNTLDVQVAFTGASRTVACRAALAEAGNTASIGYETPIGYPACFVLYAPSRRPASETEGAIVFDSGSGQADMLCRIYNRSSALYVYNVDGSAY